MITLLLIIYHNIFYDIHDGKLESKRYMETFQPAFIQAQKYTTINSSI